ncbi:hypothetical protein KUCAC02_011774, partial [Chaenocephalus aceratus]
KVPASLLIPEPSLRDAGQQHHGSKLGPGVTEFRPLAAGVDRQLLTALILLWVQGDEGVNEWRGVGGG